MTMFSYFQAVIFGLIQGVTELFPVSSLGHSVVLPKLLNWNIQQNDPFFLTFLVATHTATALVLFIFFLKDWKKIIFGVFRSLKEREVRENNPDSKLGWLIIVGTVPPGILGILLETQLQTLFASPRLVAFILILNGLLLLGAEQLRKKNLNTHKTALGSDERIAKLTFIQAIKVGLMECIALIPGFSRTGSTITGSLLVGLSHEDSARFAFLLATPIIGAASVLKLPELWTTSESRFAGQILVGAIAAGIAAYFSVKFLTKYFETKKLTPFAVYCVTIGILLSVLFLFW